MDIQIDDTKSIKEIQDEFNSKYPYLKIEFYSKPHEDHEGSPSEYTIANTNKLSDVRSVHESGELHIHGNMNVGTLEKEFKELYGLNVQVFRKSGDVWLQTSTTDDWSLSEQNNKGEEMTEGIV